MTPSLNREGRLAKVKKNLHSGKLSAALISSAININYLTSFTNFSTEERDAYLLITDDSSYLLTDGRYTEEVRQIVSGIDIIEVSGKYSMKQALKDLIKKHRLKSVGVEDENLTYLEGQRFGKLFKKIKPFSLEPIRIIKDEDEIYQLQQACLFGDELFKFILTKIKPGITEKEVAWEMEKFVKDRGAEFSFDPIVAIGVNAAIPHHHTGDDKLTKQIGQIILLDFGVKVNGYCSDMTRVVFYGQPSPEHKKIYQTVVDAHQKAVEYLENNVAKSRGKGIPANQPDLIARQYIVDQGYSDIPHSLGHGIGLEVHEAPRLYPKSKEKLKTGMVFSIEPGIYLPGDGGVRIEDLYLLTKSGLRQLTNAPKKIIEL